KKSTFGIRHLAQFHERSVRPRLFLASGFDFLFCSGQQIVRTSVHALLPVSTTSAVDRSAAVVGFVTTVLTAARCYNKTAPLAISSPTGPSFCRLRLRFTPPALP